MFNFFVKKLDPNNIKTFQDLIDLIEFYIKQKKWEKAHKILNDSIEFEKKQALQSIKKLDKTDEKKYIEKKQKIEKILKSHLKQLEDLQNKLILEEEKYKFIPERIKKFDDAIRSIKTLIALSEWDKAREAIEDIKKIEKKSFDDLLIKIEKWLRTNQNEHLFESQKKKQYKIFTKKIEQLNKLLIELEKKEEKYNKNLEEKKFEIKFKRIKQEVELLRKTWKNPEALNLLKHFLEDYPSNPKVIRFYNKNKEIILKNIEKIKQKENEKVKKSIKEEAEKLIWKTINFDNNQEEDDKDNKKLNFFNKIKEKINFYKTLREKIKRKKLIDEVSLLITENKNLNSEIAKKKLEHIHQWLIKEIWTSEIVWYNLYWKILWADKISWDTFGFEQSRNKYNFFLWDATGHWIKAGFIVTLLTRLFRQNAKKQTLAELAMSINNGLKQDLKSRNFITGILFEINKKYNDIVQFVGMWHEPMLIYRAWENKIEKLIPGWLAAGIRIIKDINQIKIKEIYLEDWDIILTYSDWVIEAKSNKWEYYWLNRLKDTFLKICQIEKDTRKIYKYIIDDLISFRWWAAFDDDVTILLLKRDKQLDLLDENSEIIKKLKFKERLEKKELKKLVWKNKQQALEELEKIKKEKQLKSIIRNLKKLYHLWEFLKLKQEASRYIKDWWIHKDINFYLRKAIDNELKYKINLKNKKLEWKYYVLEQLYKKWDYDTVIREIENIISNDWDI